MNYSPEDKRRIAHAVFEREADGYSYFPFAWSSGYPVSEAERQDYIESFNPVYASEFRKRVCARTPIRRPRMFSLLRALDVLPLAAIRMFIVFGIAAIAKALAEIPLQSKIISCFHVGCGWKWTGVIR